MYFEKIHRIITYERYIEFCSPRRAERHRRVPPNGIVIPQKPLCASSLHETKQQHRPVIVLNNEEAETNYEKPN
jgi:hypothetical protein